ncbi:polyketide cyclase / dehydrase and lipid transport [Nocardia sp. CDC159]|uniref:Polyketide cyclase / dehydrase and lipid transport n=1 Tax=Nocardia pulmonis TaxID=2951408 RepID=A0A9X2E325_9NOCA|nr:MULTISPECIES: polyketide cyclase / dehydrase and lipid transport [Nocardia]MCM6773367.1 polyketide cyclase / dehydrase and lipid transport [Nocardia pulmonis]MCM6786254.1 polyketide cyclase / dehydrase and lipid transport [Nocardia sp. CDC159]
MSSIQVADQTFVAAPGSAVAAVLADRDSWRRWWPDLALEVREDRAEKGIRWTVAGPLTGTMEVWLEPSLDGVILHYFLHAEPWNAARLTPRALLAANRQRRVAGKRMSFEVKARLEAGRPAGVSPVPVP